MKGLIRYGALVLVPALVAGLGWAFYAKLHQRRERTQYLTSLPALVARNLDGTPLPTLASTTGPVVLIYFEPDCDHCQRQATEVCRHAAEFGAARVFWLSLDSLPTLHHFAQQYGLLQQTMMRVAQIRRKEAAALGFFSVPDIRVYDMNRKFVRRYKGETSAALIINAL